MANSILVLGNSGQGKSSSMFPNKDLQIKGLKPEETFIINVAKKPLPFRGYKKFYQEFDRQTKKGNLLNSNSASEIINYITNIPKLGKFKNVIIDDANYLLTGEYMSRAKEAGFAKYTDLAKNFYDVLTAGINLPSDMNFIMFAHTEVEEGAYKLKTVGKLIDSQINPNGFFTYCLVSSTYVDTEGKTVYGFYTNSTRDDRGLVVPAKTPYGVFKDLIIPNDMGYVIDEIEKYNRGE